MKPIHRFFAARPSGLNKNPVLTACALACLLFCLPIKARADEYGTGDGYGVAVLYLETGFQTEVARIESPDRGPRSILLAPGRYQLTIATIWVTDVTYQPTTSEAGGVDFNVEFSLNVPVTNSVFQRATVIADAYNVPGQSNQSNSVDDLAANLDANNYSVSAALTGPKNTAAGTARLETFFTLQGGLPIGLTASTSVTSHAFATADSQPFANTSGRGVVQYSWTFDLGSPSTLQMSAPDPVPEPSSALLLAGAGLGLLLRRRA